MTRPESVDTLLDCAATTNSLTVGRGTRRAPSEDRDAPPYDKLTPEQQEAAEAYVESVQQAQATRLDLVATLDEGETLELDGRALTWKTASLQLGAALADMALDPRLPYTEDDAEADFKEFTSGFTGELNWDHAKDLDSGYRFATSQPLKELNFMTDASVATETEDTTSNGWTPANLDDILSADYEPLMPTLMPVEGGFPMLYPGSTHSIQGESGSGKSMLIQAEVARLLKLGEKVLYLDYESSASNVVRGRLVNTFGCLPSQIRAGLTYVRPDATPRGEGFERLLEGDYTLAVIDGVTEALNLSGLKSDNITSSNDSITAWNRLLPQRLATHTGAAVVMIDHVTKATGARSWAIGGQAKRATLTGASYSVETKERFARGRSGKLNIYLNKDREGHVQLPDTARTTDYGTLIAQADVVSEDNGRLTVAIHTPEAVWSAEDTLTARVVKVLSALKERGATTVATAVTKGTLQTEVGGNADLFKQAAQRAVEDGLAVFTEAGQKHLYHLSEAGAAKLLGGLEILGE